MTEGNRDDGDHWAVFYGTSGPPRSRACSLPSSNWFSGPQARGLLRRRLPLGPDRHARRACPLQYLMAFMLRGLVTEDYHDDVYHWVLACMPKDMSLQYLLAFMLKGYRDDAYHRTSSSTVPLGLHAQGHVFYSTHRPSCSRPSRQRTPRRRLPLCCRLQHHLAVMLKDMSSTVQLGLHAQGPRDGGS